MIASYIWTFRQFAQRLWVRATLISLLALLAAAIAPLGNYLPFAIQAKVKQDTLQGLLNILTSSMLTVATFSLSIMVSAHLAADSSATPRAYRLLQQDGRTQTVIATFIGAFIYALTLTIMIDLGVFADSEMALVYFLSVFVLALVVLALIRWVGHLDGLGSVEATMRRAEERAAQSVRDYNDSPFLGGRKMEGAVPGGARPVFSDRTGFLQNVDVGKLSSLAKVAGGAVFLKRRPGDWVARGEVLADVTGPRDPEGAEEDYLQAFAIEDRREHGQDLFYSLILLTEIGERALSPGINDPRTGVYVASRLSRLILDVEPTGYQEDPPAPNVYVPPLDFAQLIATSLDPIARDGRTFFEIGHAIQTAARDLSRHPDPEASQAAHALSARGLAYARDGVLLIDDLKRIAAIAIADGPAPTTGDEPKESVVEALGEEDHASFFREEK